MLLLEEVGIPHLSPSSLVAFEILTFVLSSCTDPLGIEMATLKVHQRCRILENSWSDTWLGSWMKILENQRWLPSEAVKDLGLWLDNTLSMSKHVTKLASSCYFFLYNLRCVRKYLSKSAWETLINALVVSRLDYCTSLFTAILPNFSHNSNVSRTVQLDSSTSQRGILHHHLFYKIFISCPSSIAEFSRSSS